MSNNNYPHYYLFKDDAFDVNADWKNKTNMTLDLMEIAQPGAAVTRRKGAWLPSEDDLLKSRVLNKGASDWVEKSRYVGTRTAKQCRERWHQTLNPDLNHAPITREEGDIILDWVTQNGTPWTLDQDRPPPERSE
ncbi:hypothetical protein E4U34_000148 [Claviceps purpurea]|nr:hypothetical protein E4U34_000148 [Claviceps purpurea]